MKNKIWYAVQTVQTKVSAFGDVFHLPKGRGFIPCFSSNGAAVKYAKSFKDKPQIMILEECPPAGNVKQLGLESYIPFLGPPSKDDYL